MLWQEKWYNLHFFFFNLFDTCSYWKILVKIFSIRKYYNLIYFSIQFSRSVVSDSVTPWTAVCQASLSITNSWSLLKLMSIKSVMPSNHLILCSPFSFCSQCFPASGSFQMSQFFASGVQSIGASASTWVLPMNIQDWCPLGWTGWISL